MKIALVSAYDYAHPGGVTEHVRHLAAGLRRRGQDVTVFAPCSDRELAERDSDFIRVGRPFPIPMHGSVARITVSLHLTNKIKHYVRDGGFDVLHYHEPLMPVLPVTALRVSRTCNVGTFHAFARSNIGYYYGKPLLKRYVRRLHARIAVSNPAREFVRHYFPGDYRVIPNGIDVKRFQNQAPYPELRDGMCNLLFVGRLEYRKGLGYLLRAFAQLKPQYPNLRLIIVGDGPLRRWYSNFLTRKQLDDVVMAGYVPASDLPRYYASCDIFCSPATGDESFGIVLLEAMASGKPIVATSIDGFREVVTHGRDGLLVAVNQLLLGGLVLMVAGFFDIFDGALARASGKVYRYGAFLDSTVDRYSEGVVYLGILIYFLQQHDGLRPIIVLIALAGSYLVSYVRARAQSLGFTCDVGILARPERVVIIVAGLLLESIGLRVGQWSPLTVALLILAVGTNFTAVQRVWVVWQQNRAELRAIRGQAAPSAGTDPAARPQPVRAAMRRFFENLGNP